MIAMKMSTAVSVSCILLLVIAEVVLSASLPPRQEPVCTGEVDSIDTATDFPTVNLGRTFRGTPYIVEITRKFMKFRTAGCKPFQVELTPNESEEIQKLSLDFVKLLDSSKISSQDDAEVLDWKDLNPIIILTNSEISIRFVKRAEPHISSHHEGGQRFIYWKFLTEYATNIFEHKLKELNVSMADGNGYHFNVDSSEDDLSNFRNFIDTIWKIMKISVSYAESNAKGWVSTTPEATQDAENEKETEVQVEGKGKPPVPSPVPAPSPTPSPSVTDFKQSFLTITKKVATI